MNRHDPWPSDLRGFLLAMFDHDIAWMPRHPGDEPPF